MRYEPASLDPKAAGCQTGTRALGLAIRSVYPELRSLDAVYGCFNRRRIAGSAAWSLHAEGRALDVGVPSTRVPLGWELACDLTDQHVIYGIQRVIWQGHIWSIEHASEWRPLARSTENQHLDHIHAENYWAAALRPPTVQSELEAALRRGRKDT